MRYPAERIYRYESLAGNIKYDVMGLKNTHPLDLDNKCTSSKGTQSQNTTGLPQKKK